MWTINWPWTVSWLGTSICFGLWQGPFAGLFMFFLLNLLGVWGRQGMDY